MSCGASASLATRLLESFTLFRMTEEFKRARDRFPCGVGMTVNDANE